MNKVFTNTLLLSVLISPLLATNGDNFISLGVASRAMGGTGIAHYSPGASATGNPALITKAKGGEFTFGGTYLKPSVKVKTSDTGETNDLSATSSSKENTTPYAALTNQLDNGFSIGGSMFGAAGMGTDWTEGAGAVDPSAGTIGLYSMKASLTMLKISVPVAYQYNDFSFGVAPVMMFATLGMSFISPTLGPVGEDPSSDTGLGIELGMLYSYEPWGVGVGVVYHSPISLSYKNQISTISKAFGYGSTGANFSAFSDELEQPEEFGIGIDWTKDAFSISADYRRINWGHAAGYKDFNWEDQDVYAVGAEYRIDALSLRLGYNYGKNPIKPSSDPTPVSSSSPATNGDVINTFNHVMFPAITQNHYTVGAGYQFNEAVSADIALIYATSSEVTVSAQSVGLGEITVTNNQFAASAALNVIF